jgi:membrane fusion protein (multidrug efflux system)
MTKRMILMLVAVTVVFGLIFGYKAIVNHFINDFFDNMQMPPASITATEVVEDLWIPSTEAVGTFVAVAGAELTVEVAGTVTTIHFENGQPVSRGQVLVSLDIETDQADLERLEAAAELAALEQRRLERLHLQQSVSEADLERARSESAQAQASVRAQQARIRQKTVRSPTDGIAGIRRVNVGQYVQPGQQVVTVGAADPLYLNFSLPERRLAQVVPGQTLAVTTDVWADQLFEGEITAIEPRVNESTRTFEVQATIANPERLLRSGMFGRVHLETGAARSVLVIPQTAVQFNPYGNAVFVIHENGDTRIVQQRLVRTGQTRGDLIEVVEGLEPGDRIATSGLLKLRNDATVTIIDNSQVQPSADQAPRPENR